MKGKKRIMRKFSIREISGVDVPAQRGARALIMKRGDPDDDPVKPKIDKAGVVQLVTGETNGHSHGVSVYSYDGRIEIYLAYAQANENAAAGHSHSILLDSDGTYSVVQNAGHTHTLDATDLATAIVNSVRKQDDNPKGVETMTDEEKAELEKANKMNERMKKIIALKAANRAYFDELKGEDVQDAFLDKSADDQDAEVKAADAKKNDADPVVYTTKDGVDIRKSDGANTLATAKALDGLKTDLETMKADNAKLTEERDKATFEKRAETELAHLPGSVEIRAALLKAAESFEDEDQRKDALAALKAQNSAHSELFVNRGISTGGDIEKTIATGANPQAELDKMAEAYQKDHPDITIEQAHVEVMKTEAGSKLYSEVIKSDRSAAMRVAA